MNKKKIKLTPYIIKGKPVFVYNAPTSSSNIINALAPETEIKVIAEEKGYLKLIDGGYVMKSSHTVEDIQKIKIQRAKKILRSKRKMNHDDEISLMSLNKSSSNPYEGKVFNFKDTMTTDTNGTPIDDSYKSETTALTCYGISRDGLLQLEDPSTGKRFYAPPSYLNIKDASAPEDVKFTDAGTWTTNKIGSVEENYIWTEAVDLLNGQISPYLQKGIEAVSTLLEPGKLKIENTRSIFGMPYQFNKLTDNRLGGNEGNSDNTFGRKYAQKIVSRAPVLIMQAGTPTFLKGFNDDQKKSMIEGLGKTAAEGAASLTGIQSTVNSAGKYYSFKDASNEYFRGVNQMCRAMAVFLGITDETINVNGHEDKIGNFDWRKASEQPNFGYYRGAVGFYVNAEAQTSDGIANGTRASALSGQVNQLSDQAAELQFILGGIVSSDIPGLSSVANKLQTSGDKAVDSANKANDTQNNTGLIGAMINNINTLMAGGKLIFPEIWSDSSFTKNYNITIKLDSPDCDKLSIYLNILVPLAHIMGFCLPRYSGSNAYVSPFLVRAYLRSMFHIDMGIITSCEIIKGDNQAWNQDGLPTQITVQMTLKDLYSVMAMMLADGKSDLIANPAQLDYLANLCGLNIASPGIEATLMLWYTLRNPKTIAVDAINGVFSDFSRYVNRKWLNLLDSYWTM